MFVLMRCMAVPRRVCCYMVAGMKSGLLQMHSRAISLLPDHCLPVCCAKIQAAAPEPWPGAEEQRRAQGQHAGLRILRLAAVAVKLYTADWTGGYVLSILNSMFHQRLPPVHLHTKQLPSRPPRTEC
mmetsp:Transcript_3833/g.8209  ORF Transcript_3833/g.8209 Transcript_3833/m.8209 type:complete len:127 (-) Transcript_3833:230-610(-)